MEWVGYDERDGDREGDTEGEEDGDDVDVDGDGEGDGGRRRQLKEGGDREIQECTVQLLLASKDGKCSI